MGEQRPDDASILVRKRDGCDIGVDYHDTGLRFAGTVRAGFIPHLRREVFKAPRVCSGAHGAKVLPRCSRPRAEFRVWVNLHGHRGVQPESAVSLKKALCNVETDRRSVHRGRSPLVEWSVQHFHSGTIDAAKKEGVHSIKSGAGFCAYRLEVKLRWCSRITDGRPV